MINLQCFKQFPVIFTAGLSKEDVIHHIQLWDQFIILKDCHDGRCCLTYTMIQTVKSGNDVQQCGFTRTGFSPKSK